MNGIFRALTLSALLLCAGAGVAAQSNSELLRKAVNAAGAGNWDDVYSVRPQLKEPVVQDVVDWMRLRARQGSFGECRDFLKRNADWPGLPLMRLRCEALIKRGGDPDAVLDYFAEMQPQTGTGSLRLAEALYRTKQNSQGDDEIKRAWLKFQMNKSEHEAFVNRNGLTVKDLHEERLDMLLWRGAESAADRMIPLVGDGWTRLAKARLALRGSAPGVDKLIEEVPKELADNPGLAYERFEWRMRKDRVEGAVDILLERSVSTEALGRPEYWSNRRRSLARDFMRAGNHALAYALASSHYLEDGSDFADLEWLSGFLALRFLDAPDQAIFHFQRFQGAVETPISLGRAGYWLGRAYEAAGEEDQARVAYEFGATYQSSFYGQLAAERGGVAADPNMAGTEDIPGWEEASFKESSVFQAAVRLKAAGLQSLATRFFVHLGESLDRTELAQLGHYALEAEDPYSAVKIAKQAARQGHEIYAPYFPVATPAGMNLPVETAFALAIARRESEFNPEVVSSAGARGLMQLMPATAKEVASWIDETYSRDRLLTDPKYNARLGSEYLSRLSRKYDENPVLMSIAYNAGPGRANRWMKEFGDPRDADTDVIDWIEFIPFRETRNYAMRVTESLAVYRARLSGEAEPPTLSRQLKR